MLTKGKITKWNDEKGFGFIAPNTAGKQVFIHISAFNNCSSRPEINQEVIYTLCTDKHGRPCAENATLPGDNLRQNSNKRNGTFSILLSVSWLVIISMLAVTEEIPLPLLVIYFGCSIITFAAYAMDKSAAKRGAWRTSESTLHLLSLLGGWPERKWGQVYY